MKILNIPDALKHVPITTLCFSSKSNQSSAIFEELFGRIRVCTFEFKFDLLFEYPKVLRCRGSQN